MAPARCTLLSLLCLCGACGRIGFDWVEARPSGGGGNGASSGRAGSGPLAGGGGISVGGSGGVTAGAGGEAATAATAGAGGAGAGGAGGASVSSGGGGGVASAGASAGGAGGVAGADASGGANGVGGVPTGGGPTGGAGGCSAEPLPTDTVLDGAVPASCVPGALVCDDMEAPPPPETAHAVSSNAVATRTSCRAHGGARAMHVALTTNTARSAVTYYAFPAPITSGTLYGRQWFQLADVALPTWIDLVELAYAGGKTSIDIMQDGSIRYNVLSGGAFPTSPAATVPRGRWVCLTYSVTVGDAGRVTAELDGVPILDLATDTLASGYESVFFGAWVSRGTAGLELYVDDVVLATQPVGCD